MKIRNARNRIMISNRVYTILLALLLLVGVAAAFVYADDGAASSKRLQNGSFEDSQSWTDKTYNQPNQSAVPNWNTTAFEGKIELFRENTSTYIPNVLLAPSAGSYAAELNADEESTLYQNVSTTPSSIYEWGLDHGARNYADTMALVIGPKQINNPSKPNKGGRDQLMQMVDWLIDQRMASIKLDPGVDKELTVYSKKFGTAGTFVDNAGNNAFSLTPSTIYTEEWHIWIMTSNRAPSGTNPWSSYGSNAGGSAGSSTGNGSTEVDLSKYYLYTVPAGQTETLFGFVSVGCYKTATEKNTDKTFGNFLDNINFQLYHPLSSSTTTHGSAVIGGSDGSSSVEGGASEGHQVTVDNKLATFVTDGKTLKIQAVVKKNDADAGCEFVGLYYTKQNDSGDPVSEFLQIDINNVIEDTGNLTDEEKIDKWIKSVNTNGDIIYTYYLEGLTTATDLHFVFIKNPTITYDPNGGKPYVVERQQYNQSEEPNVYSFKPAIDDEKYIFIPPYVSHEAEGQNDGWKFLGWLLTGDTDSQVNADQLGTLLLPAIHTVACDYSFAGATQQSAAQYFKIYNSEVSLDEKRITEDEQVKGVEWTTDTEEEYANYHKGLTLVAQWRWRQEFIPQVNGTSLNSYEDSDLGGTVDITSVANPSEDPNYTADSNKEGGKAYYATTDETITATATAKPGFTFEGWYDASGKLITTNTTYSYVETKESVNTYYARFSGSITQTYIRQVKEGDAWNDTTDDSIGTLDRYSYTDAVGTPISSTATAGTSYKFVGWYDSHGNQVASNMLINNGATISYTTSENATYYARFETAYTVQFAAQTKQQDGSYKTDNTGGKVSVASATDVANASVSSKATANSGYRFLGWFDSAGNFLGNSAIYTTTTILANHNKTFYARFEIVYSPKVESKVYLSFVAESEKTQIPSVFNGRDAGAGEYGLDDKFGNTISTGFQYSLDKMTDVKTIQITVNVPASAYVKVGGTGNFTGNGNSILADSDAVTYNKGSIQQISGATILTYYWDATGLEANTLYGFIIDNLYAPGATATITVNGTVGTKVTNDNGVVNTASEEYRANSHYPK